MSTNQIEGELSVSNALDIISSYFPHEWTCVNEDDIKIVAISGGYMNKVYLVERCTESVVEPSSVILRQKGGGIIKVAKSEDMSSIMASEAEEVVMALESSRATTGPHLYGVFAGGRVEEYVKSHTLTSQDVTDETINENLARCFARFHSMNVPYKKVSYTRIQKKIDETIDQFQKGINYILDPLIGNQFASTPSPVDWNFIKTFDFAGEFRFISRTLSQINCRTVITAGDPNYLNVLVREGPVPAGKLQVVLVDYELASYQPRGFELGGHFANRLVKWNDPIDKSSGYDIINCEARQRFINHYTDEIHRVNKLENLDATGLDSSANIMLEADVGIIHYLLLFGFFITAKLELMAGDTAFPSGVVALLKSYLKLKVFMQSKYPNWK